MAYEDECSLATTLERREGQSDGDMSSPVVDMAAHDPESLPLASLPCLITAETQASQETSEVEEETQTRTEADSERREGEGETEGEQAGEREEGEDETEVDSDADREAETGDVAESGTNPGGEEEGEHRVDGAVGVGDCTSTAACVVGDGDTSAIEGTFVAAMAVCDVTPLRSTLPSLIKASLASILPANPSPSHGTRPSQTPTRAHTVLPHSSAMAFVLATNISFTPKKINRFQ